jgi:hypothetical protein
LSCPDPVWVIVNSEDERVVVAAVDGVPIAETDRLALRGEGYASEDEALAAGRRWGARLLQAFASINVAADFGPPKPTSGFSSYGLETLGPAGVRKLNDVHGLQAFESEPPPVFMAIDGLGVHVSSPHERMELAMSVAIAEDRELTERQKTAYDLYAASSFVGGGDSRFLMLMMAVETLTEQGPRPPESQSHVEALIAQTQASGLSKAEVDSLVGSLRWLTTESIGQAGRRLVASLEPAEYDGMNPVAFFNKCYQLRSSLVHGAVPRPDAETVTRFAANLEHLVANLLSPPAILDPASVEDLPQLGSGV